MPDIGSAIGGGLGFLGQIFGAEKQSEAIEKAAKSTENWQKYLVALEEKKYDEAARFRDLAYREGNLQYQQAQKLLPMYTRETMATYPETMGLLRKNVLAEPGTSPAYQTALTRGTKSIMQNLAPYGLSPRSSVAGEATGELAGSLLSTDYENYLNNQFRLAGFGTQPSMQGISPETGYPNMGYATQAQGNLAELGVAGGAVQGGLYGSMGQDLMRMPYYYNLLNQGQPTSGNVNFPSSIPQQGTSISPGGFLKW